MAWQVFSSSPFRLSFSSYIVSGLGTLSGITFIITGNFMCCTILKYARVIKSGKFWLETFSLMFYCSSLIFFVYVLKLEKLGDFNKRCMSLRERKLELAFKLIIATSFLLLGKNSNLSKEHTKLIKLNAIQNKFRRQQNVHQSKSERRRQATFRLIKKSFKTLCSFLMATCSSTRCMLW